MLFIWYGDFFPLGQGCQLFCIEEDKTYLERLCFSDEATFHVCGTVNRHLTVTYGKVKILMILLNMSIIY